MAQVRTKDCLVLIEQALDKLFTSNPELAGLEEHKKFDALAREVENKTRVKLKPDTLYKNMALRLRREENPVVGFHKRYLNGLAQYVYDKNYYEVYRYEKEMTPVSQLDKQPPKSINKEEESKQLCYLIYTLEQVQEANHLIRLMEERFNCSPRSIMHNASRPFDFLKLYREKPQAVGIMLMGMDLLKNENYLKNLVQQAGIESNIKGPDEGATNKKKLEFWENTLHILMPDASDPSSGITTLGGRVGFSNYWKEYAQRLIKSLPDEIQSDVNNSIKKGGEANIKPTTKEYSDPSLSSLFDDWVSVHDLHFKAYPILQRLVNSHTITWDAANDPANLKFALLGIAKKRNKELADKISKVRENVDPFEVVTLHQSLPNKLAGKYILYHEDYITEGNLQKKVLRKSYLIVADDGGSFVIDSSSGRSLKGVIKARFGATVSIDFSGMHVMGEGEDTPMEGRQAFEGELRHIEEGILAGSYQGQNHLGMYESNRLLLVKVPVLPVQKKTWIIEKDKDAHEIALEIEMVRPLGDWNLLGGESPMSLLSTSAPVYSKYPTQIA